MSNKGWFAVGALSFVLAFIIINPVVVLTAVMNTGNMVVVACIDHLEMMAAWHRGEGGIIMFSASVVVAVLVFGWSIPPVRELLTEMPADIWGDFCSFVGQFTGLARDIRTSYKRGRCI